MIAMEYAFAFPDDFDMALIRRRVGEKGRLFNTYPGLLRKAFLARDRRADSQTEPAGVGNSYATFYHWSSAKAAADFLGGPDFAAVCAAFGRPAVRLFAPLGITIGQETAAPTTAIRAVATMAADANLAAEIAARRASLDALRDRPGFHSGILSLDSANWSILCFSLWATAASAEAVANGSRTRYEVLHLSTPAPGLPLAEERYEKAG